MSAREQTQTTNKESTHRCDLCGTEHDDAEAALSCCEDALATDGGSFLHDRPGAVTLDEVGFAVKYGLSNFDANADWQVVPYPGGSGLTPGVEIRLFSDFRFGCELSLDEAREMRDSLSAAIEEIKHE